MLDFVIAEATIRQLHARYADAGVSWELLS